MSIVTPFPIPSTCSCGGKYHKHGKRERHVIEQEGKLGTSCKDYNAPQKAVYEKVEQSAESQVLKVFAMEQQRRFKKKSGAFRLGQEGESCLKRRMKSTSASVVLRLGAIFQLSRGDTKRQLMEALEEVSQGSQIPVIVVDEAHLLSHDMLEEIRFLLNLEMGGLCKCGVEGKGIIFT